MLALRIALRYLFARKSHTAVNIISMISMAGIAVAAMAMVCVLSVFNGFTDIAVKRLSLVDPVVKITRADNRVIPAGDSLAAAIKNVEGVVQALPTLEQQALALYGDVQHPVTVRGVPAGYSAVSAIDSLVIDGEMLLDETGQYHHPTALLSVGAAVAIGARPSAERALCLTVPRRLGRINPAFPMSAFVVDTLLVSGVYQTNQAEHDEDVLYIPLPDARRLYDYTTEATAIELALTPGTDESRVIKALTKQLGPEYIAADRLRQQEDAFRMIGIEKWISFLMLVFVLVMASFNILSTMSMLIIEKETDMAILRSLGATDRMVRRIFLDEGMLIAVIGGAIGIAIGIVLSLLQQHFGIISLGGDHSQMSVTTYPCHLLASDVLLTAAIVSATGLISGLISSRQIKPTR